MLRPALAVAVAVNDSVPCSGWFGALKLTDGAVAEAAGATPAPGSATANAPSTASRHAMRAPQAFKPDLLIPTRSGRGQPAAMQAAAFWTAESSWLRRLAEATHRPPLAAISTPCRDCAYWSAALGSEYGPERNTISFVSDSEPTPLFASQT
jgi:hypothetical protein